MQDIIIEQPWGGLGDNLQYSTLPKLYSKLGHNVYISSKNMYRNPEIYKLVWELNPYIKGISDLPTNAGAITYFNNFHKVVTENSIKNVELSHNLINGTEEYPEIYYTPKYIPELENIILFDTTSITLKNVYSNNKLAKSIDDIINNIINNYPELTAKHIHFTKISNNDIPIKCTDKYIINSIFDYCDAIFSCKIYISPQSGNSCLASSIKKKRQFPIIYMITPERHRDSYIQGEYHDYNNITRIYI